MFTRGIFSKGELVIIKFVDYFMIGKIEGLTDTVRLTEDGDLIAALNFGGIGLKYPYVIYITNTDNKSELVFTKIVGFNYSNDLLYIPKYQIELLYKASPDVIEQFNSFIELENKSEVESKPIRRIKKF
jgi:hypothetical protein